MPALPPWRLLSAWFLGAFAATSIDGVDQKKLPNIVFILLDDWGWSGASWHREKGYKEVQTPRMQSLVDSGIELDRHYVHKFCSPTRCAIQSGRNPIHVNAQNVAMTRFDPENPRTGISGIPVNMTGFAQHLAKAGYKHRIFAGKSDIGMAYYRQTPMGRGYTDALFYFNHDNDYWSFGKNPDDGGCHLTASESPPVARDLFGTNPDGTSGPQYHLLSDKHCWGKENGGEGGQIYPENMTGCVYEEDLFTNFTIKHIEEHDPNDGPLLAFHSAHSIHGPLEVVPDAFHHFDDIVDFQQRQKYQALVFNIDRAIGRIVDALVTKGMYDNTLIVLSADNGGPVYGGGGGNNYPLKGGKASNWEGGIRANAFVSGGFVPEAMRGRKLEGLLTGWDWYATFVHGIAGLDPTDEEAAAEGLPPIDSVDQWPYLSGATDVPPRTEIPFGTAADAHDTWSTGSNNLAVHTMIQADPESGTLWKLMLGSEAFGAWTGPETPNATGGSINADPTCETCVCGFDPGCLFDLSQDPSEHVNVASQNPEVVQRMLEDLRKHNATVFAPKRPNNLAMACAVVNSKYRDPVHDFGWWGPFADEPVPVPAPVGPEWKQVREDWNCGGAGHSDPTKQTGHSLETCVAYCAGLSDYTFSMFWTEGSESACQCAKQCDSGAATGEGYSNVVYEKRWELSRTDWNCGGTGHSDPSKETGHTAASCTSYCEGRGFAMFWTKARIDGECQCTDACDHGGALGDGFSNNVYRKMATRALV